MRREQHQLLGVGAGFIAELVRQAYLVHAGRQEQVEWADVMISGAIGGLAAMVPDTLEPATHPRHRGSFHSFAFAFGLGALLAGLRSVLQPQYQGAVTGAGAGILSHLAADAATRNGIPLVG